METVQAVQKAVRLEQAQQDIVKALGRLEARRLLMRDGRATKVGP